MRELTKKHFQKIGMALIITQNLKKKKLNLNNKSHKL